MEQFMSVPLRQMTYQPFGDLLVWTSRRTTRSPITAANSTSTPRSPDAVRATRGSTYSPEAFASYPDQVDRRAHPAAAASRCRIDFTARATASQLPRGGTPRPLLTRPVAATQLVPTGQAEEGRVAVRRAAAGHLPGRQGQRLNDGD